MLIEFGAATDPIRWVDGCPLPVCVSTRVPRCRLFPEVADWGDCAAKNQYYYGLHGHLLVTFDGVITGCTVTPASGDEREALWELTEGVRGLVMGDKGFGAFLQADLATVGIDLQTPLPANMTDPRPPWAIRQLTSARRLAETVIGPLAEQFHFEKIRARDVWHLTSRIPEKSWRTPGVFS